MTDLINFCDFSKSELWDLGLILVKGLLAFFLYFLASLLLRFLLGRLSLKVESHKKAIIHLLSKALSVLLLSLGFITALGTWGFDVTGIIATLGLTGFAVGLALKDAIANIVSGILLILYAPFKIGAKVKIAGREGVVTKIEIKHTTLEEEGVVHILPNSKVLGEVISIIT